MADGDDRSDLFSLRKLDHLANLTLLENAHNDRAETMCVRRKAERLSGNAGVERLPVRALGGREAAVALKAGAAGDRRQDNERRCVRGGLLVVRKIHHAVGRETRDFLLVRDEIIARSLRVLPARRIGCGGNDLRHLLAAYCFFGEFAHTAARFDTFQCFHDIFSLFQAASHRPGISVLLSRAALSLFFFIIANRRDKCNRYPLSSMIFTKYLRVRGPSNSQK